MTRLLLGRARGGAGHAAKFAHEHNDTLMVAYLAGVTKSVASLNDLSDKMMLAFNAHRRI